MARQTRDQYANILNGACTVDGTTIVTTEITTGVSLGEGRGMLIDEIDYHLSAALINTIDADAEQLRIAWSTQSLSASSEFVYSNSRIIHLHQKVEKDWGTPGNAVFVDSPSVFQFFPPMIVAAPKLFINTYATAGIAGLMESRIFFRYVDLSAAEYLELAESFVLIS